MRLAELARKLDLRLERAPLIVVRRVVAVVVEPGLADRDDLRVGRRLSDRLEVRGLEPGGRVRVPAHDREHLLLRVREAERAGDRVVVDADRRDTREAVRRRGILVAHLEMAVRVDHGMPRLTARMRRTDACARERGTRPRSDRARQMRGGPLRRRVRRVEHQVHTRPGGPHADLRGTPIGGRGGRAERVRHRHAAEAETAPQLAARDAARERGGKPGIERAVDRRAQHHQPDASAEHRAIRALVDPAQPLARRVDRHPREVGVGPRRAEAGEVLAGREHAGATQSGGERAREPRDLARAAAVRAPLALHRAARPRDVGNRGEIDVDSSRAQVAARGATRAARRAHVARRPDLGRRAHRRAGKPPDGAALLVDHHEQRLVERGRAADGLEPADQAPNLPSGSARSARTGSPRPPFPGGSDAGDPAAGCSR